MESHTKKEIKILWCVIKSMKKEIKNLQNTISEIKNTIPELLTMSTEIEYEKNDDFYVQKRLENNEDKTKYFSTHDEIYY